jgi:hypothetical protein
MANKFVERERTFALSLVRWWYLELSVFAKSLKREELSPFPL